MRNVKKIHKNKASKELKGGAGRAPIPVLKTREAKYRTAKTFIPVPAKQQKLTSKLFNHQLTKKNYQGEAVEDDNKIVLWVYDNIFYKVKLDDWIKANYKTPKVYVSQDKNINVLTYLFQKQNYSLLKNLPNLNIEERERIKKNLKVKFTLKDYALLRGYTEEEFNKSGNFLENLKDDLRWGSYISYKLDNYLIDGKLYKVSGLPPFYILYEPKLFKGEWIIDFNEPYKSHLINAFAGKEQYYIYNLKEIQDKETTEKPYLHIFYKIYIGLKKTYEPTFFVKIRTLLLDMGLNYLMDKPKECIKILSECLQHFSKYPDEFNQIILSKNLDFSNESSLIIKNLEVFNYDYLKQLCSEKFGVNWRDLYISFSDYKRTERLRNKILKPSDLLDEKAKLQKRVWSWVKRSVNWDKMRDWNQKDTERIIRQTIERVGVKKVLELFESEANAPYPDAVLFMQKLSKLQ